MRWALTSLVVVARLASAHEGLHTQASARATNEIDATVTVTAADAVLPTRAGQYVTVLPAARVASAWRMWAELAMPVHSLHATDGDQLGPGDLMFGAGYGLLRAGPWALDVALWSMWPTGNPYVGLGSGHVMAAPQVGAALAVGRFRFDAGAMVRGAVAVGEHAHHSHQPLVSPHDLVDVKLSQRGTLRLADAVELCAHVDEVVVAVPHPTQPVGTRASAGLGAALTLGDFRADLAFTAPLTRKRAWEWQLVAALTYRFSAPSTDPKTARP